MRFPALLLVAFSLACSLWPGSVNGPISSADRQSVAAPEPGQVPVEVTVDPEWPTPPEPDAPPTPPASPPTPYVFPPVIPHADLVAAFEADCGFVPEVSFDDLMGPQRQSACHALEFDQMCAPDTTGCWGEHERCKEACGTPCDGCSATCAGSCRDCNAACAGAGPECKHACAESRATCHEGCATTRKECMDVACSAAYDTCAKAYEDRVASECGTACDPYIE